MATVIAGEAEGAMPAIDWAKVSVDESIDEARPRFLLLGRDEIALVVALSRVFLVGGDWVISCNIWGALLMVSAAIHISYGKSPIPTADVSDTVPVFVPAFERLRRSMPWPQRLVFVSFSDLPGR